MVFPWFSGGSWWYLDFPFPHHGIHGPVPRRPGVFGNSPETFEAKSPMCQVGADGQGIPGTCGYIWLYVNYSITDVKRKNIVGDIVGNI